MSGERFSTDIIKTTRLQFELGTAASGTIDPAGRELEPDIVKSLENDIVTGYFDVPVTEGIILPCGCIDGRCPRPDDVFNAVPNAAGGTLSLLVGELLTDEVQLANSQTSAEALSSLIGRLQDRGYENQIGGHSGPAHGSETASGCGANDQLPAILQQMTEKPDVFLSVLDKLNVPRGSEAEFTNLIVKAKQLVDDTSYFSTGKTIAELLDNVSVEGNCPALVGAHNELLIRLNTNEGTTLDRRAIQAAYGDDYQIFNVDVWSLKRASEVLSHSDDEARRKFAAMVMYQVATALQLCGPSMRVIVT